MIIGGGSAADHGVVTGNNVHTGPGVVIGGSTPLPTAGQARTTISKPADYDPKHFDPVAYLPKAEALAQQLIPDAKLTMFEFDPVYSDGHLDLTVDGSDREYRFRSVKMSERPAGVPRNAIVERACMVYVEVGTHEITARIRTSEDCDARLVPHPKCRFTGLWKQALAQGVASDNVARIGWMSDAKWFFDTELSGKAGGVSTFADRCP